MAVTRLDWDVFTYGTHPRLTPFPWITGRVRKGDAYTVLNELCRRFNNEVEKINPAHSWGWAYRPVRGATVVSEHGAGTAIDLNAPKHPLGRQGTFTRSQVTKINQILRDLDGAVRWGGNYAGRKDEMHFELQGGVKKLAAVAKKIQGGTSTGTASTSKPATRPKPKPAKALRSDSWLRKKLVKITTGTKKNTTGHLVGLYQRQQRAPYKLVHDQHWGPVTDQHFRWVGQLQKEMNRWKGTKLAVDGSFGDSTFNRVVEWQKRNMGNAYKGTIADGVVGPLTIKPLGIKKYPN